jgi:putative NADH-flavin reductase
MKIALAGATGYVGSRVLAEALRRGHAVTAIARDVSKLTPAAGLTLAQGDLGAPGIVPLLAGHDAVVIAVKSASIEQRSVVEMVKLAAVARLLVVGGAGSLEVAPGLDLVDSPQFPAQWKPEALAARNFLRLLREERTLDWTLLSPSALLEPGERTNRFRLGCDQLLRDAKGESRISVEDLAVALIDELETPRHSRLRFTAGY